MLAKIVAIALEIVLAHLPDIWESVKKSSNQAEAEARIRALIKRKGIESAYNAIRKEL